MSVIECGVCDKCDERERGVVKVMQRFVLEGGDRTQKHHEC